ncbi:hypothetical protein [Sphingomonas sp. Root710]|uniref:hypothetical protein n=1 Tax=Sphingomonas sp. Root710 TaxID=1736594 RepID=UPI0012E333DC|nr:hypothetical protein [Sphingomonas sp. Root710]
MQNPETALRWRKDDAVALTLLADQRQAEGLIDIARARQTAEVARKALLSEPLTAPALRQLAVAEAIEGRAGSSRRLLELAHDVSRRDLGTSWLFVTEALARGDVSLLMRSFDEAAATSQVGRDLMYPAFAEGLFDPGLRAALIPYLREQRPWMPSFLRFAAVSSPATGSYTAYMVMAARGLPRNPAYDGIDASILGAVATEGNFELARAYLRHGLSGGETLLSEIGFTPATTDDGFGPFAWKLSDNEEGGAHSDGATGLRIRISADHRTEVARRILLLSPGGYRLVQWLRAPGGFVKVGLYWKMTCLAGPRETTLWEKTVSSGEAKSIDKSDIFVPVTACPAQQLILTAGGGSDQGDVELALSAIKLVRR